MTSCYQNLGLNAEAEKCLRIMERGRSQTAYSLSKSDQTSQTTDLHQRYGVVTISTDVESLRLTSSSDSRSARSAAERTAQREGISTSAMLIPRVSRQIDKIRALSEKRLNAQLHEDNVRALYRRTQELLESARYEDTSVLNEWVASARGLIKDFGSQRDFFPWDKGARISANSQRPPKSMTTQADQSTGRLVNKAQEAAGRSQGNGWLLKLPECFLADNFCRRTQHRSCGSCG